MVKLDDIGGWPKVLVEEPDWVHDVLGPEHDHDAVWFAGHALEGRAQCPARVFAADPDQVARRVAQVHANERRHFARPAA